MRIRRSRIEDANFELNLAPFLDIVVSVIPMLLLSVAFVQIKMIETSVPQVVADKITEQKEDKLKISMSLEASRKSGYTFIINDNGQTKKTNVAIKNGQLDYQALQAVAIETKKQYVDVFKMDFLPKSDVTYDEIVLTMDALRRMPAGQKVSIKDSKTGQPVTTDLMFPDVTFANVLGE